MALAARQRAVHWKTEATPGTYETITIGTHTAVRVRDVKIELVGADGKGVIWRDDGDYADADGIGSQPPVLGGRYWKVTGVAEWVSPSTAADFTTSDLEPLFLGSPIALVESGSVVLTPAIDYAPGTAPKPFSMRIDDRGGRAYKLQGCVSSWKVVWTSGRVVDVPFEILGNWVETPGAAGSLASIVYTNNNGPNVAVAMTLTHGIGADTAAGLTKGEFDPMIKVEPRPAAEAAAGYAIPMCYYDGPAFLRYSLDSDSVGIWGEAIALTQETSVSLAWADSTIAMTSVYTDTPDQSEEGGVRKFDVEARVRSPAGRGAHWTWTIL